MLKEFLEHIQTGGVEHINDEQIHHFSDGVPVRHKTNFITDKWSNYQPPTKHKPDSMTTPPFDKKKDDAAKEPRIEHLFRYNPGWLGGGPNMDDPMCQYTPFAYKCGYRAALDFMSPIERSRLMRRYLEKNGTTEIPNHLVNFFKKQLGILRPRTPCMFKPVPKKNLDGDILNILQDDKKLTKLIKDRLNENGINIDDKEKEAFGFNDKAMMPDTIDQDNLYAAKSLYDKGAKTYGKLGLQAVQDVINGVPVRDTMVGNLDGGRLADASDLQEVHPAAMQPSFL